MKKFLALLIVFLLAGLCYGAGNTTAWTDSSDVADMNGEDTVRYSKWFDLGRYDYIFAVLKVDDIDEAGFADDSIQVEWGYQLGFVTTDSTTATGGKRDTGLYPAVVVDTLSSDSLGKTSQANTIGANGSVDMNLGWLDTTNVTGFAYTAVNFFPDWSELIRFKFTGLAGTSEDSALQLIVEPHRRLGVPAFTGND